MGDHALFQNTSTAKRFPFLATVPQHELSAMFNVPAVDREQEKLNELQYSEPYVDPKISFRELSSSNAPSSSSAAKANRGLGASSGGGGEGGDYNSANGDSNSNNGGGTLQRDQLASSRPAFIPSNASHAKQAVLGTQESVFVGTYQDEYLHTQKSFAASQSLVVSHRPFSRGRSNLAAAELIGNKYYLNAMDSEVAQQVREMTKHRIKENRAILQEQQLEQILRNRGQHSRGASGSGSRLPALTSGPRLAKVMLSC
ncbi:Hypothetical protein, putative [Bodo saltans]|uniref:Uncharacterized protein n=1 Tax=Bodo saltans TaxID=75058 RepID=A0A0S4IVB4_BODSA|nr:Hypothetical protein, putative [Bodo saltans]|eukprot:CUG16922.1 Hypothetical protein, putative [Bodo saltans]